MIKFFRHIRQNLLMKNLPAGQAGKASKYFKYAIGEIILVVIGILIALQINNWNEKRQQKISERAYLERLIEDLENDTKYFSRRDTAYQNKQIDIGKLVDTFFANQNYKGFDYIIQNMDESLTELLVSKKTYDEMVSTGVLFSIDDKNILTEIQDYYNWGEINQYYVKTNNNDLAANWQKPFYGYIIIARHFAKNNLSFNHLDLDSLYEQTHQNNIDLKSYLLRYQRISEIKLELFQDQLKYSKKLIETLKNQLSTK